MPEFGASLAPRQARLGVLSSGVARETNGSNMLFKKGRSDERLRKGAPGYKPAAGAPDRPRVYDVATVKLQLRAPMNAKKASSFDFSTAGEWPGWCARRTATASSRC
ncbi:MAG: hypothetical protein U0235_13885 [Polyangiaceae bacterium]